MKPNFASSEERFNPCCGGGPRADSTGSSSDVYRTTLELYRSARAQTLALVQGLSETQMDYLPAAGKWSVGEVLDHLLLGERLNLSYIVEVIEMKKAGQPPVLNLSFTDMDVSVGYLPKSLLPLMEVPFTVVNMFLPASLRDFMTRYRLLPAQSAEITTPRHGRPAGELRADLISSLEETETFLEAHSNLNYADMVVQHPLLGINSITDLLRFLALHEQRHQSQIKDIMSAAHFPQRLPSEESC